MSVIAVDVKTLNLDTWLEKITHFHAREIDLGLDALTPIAEKLSLTTFAGKVITIAGTNGKGSTAKTIHSIASAAGLSVGLYSSPHIKRFNERININGADVDDNALCEAFAIIDAARGDVALTYFEFTTLAALLLFKRAKLDLIILEVGLGGRLDAVNIVEPDVSVITAIALDHQDYLGNTLETIAAEKAGIMRSGKPVIVGSRQAYALLWPWATKKQAHIIACGYQYDFQRDKADQWYWYMPGEGHVVELKKTAFPVENAAAAIATCQVLGLPIQQAAIQQGIQNAFVPGRCQVLNTAPLTIIDVAHNPHACTYLSETLRSYPQITRWHAVFGCMQDKDMEAMLRTMRRMISAWYFVPLDDPRGASLDMLNLAASTLKLLNVSQHKHVTEACLAASQSVKSNEGIVVFGSFLTIVTLLH